ncbi:hypothetical protein EsHS_00000722 [Epichloe bromicola]
MAPVLRARQSLSKDRFSSYFSSLRSQPYSDPNSTRGGSHSLRAIAWNPLGNLIATGSMDKTLRVWNPEKPHVKFSTELKGHTASVEKVAFNPTKDAELCSVSTDGVVKFWDVRTKACFNESDTIFVLSPRQSTPLATHQQDMQTNQISFCYSGTKIFATTSEGRIRILSYPDFQPVLTMRGGDEEREFMLNGHTSSCLTAEVQPTGRYLATGGSDSIIALWDTTDWICFTFDGSYIVGGSDEGTGLEVSHVETGEHVHTFKTAVSMAFDMDLKVHLATRNDGMPKTGVPASAGELDTVSRPTREQGGSVHV